MGLYVTNDLSAHVLFTQPKNERPGTFFARPTDSYSERYLYSGATLTPVEVKVNQETQDMSALRGMVNSDLAVAGSVNQRIQDYLEGALSLVEDMKDIVDVVVDNTNLTDADRSAFDADLQTMLPELDNYFDRGSYGTEKVMQGGSREVGSTPDGAQVPLDYGDMDRQTLGLSSLDVTSVSSAETSQTALEDAIGMINDQIRVAEKEGRTFTSRSDVNTAVLADKKKLLSKSVTYDYELATQENNRAALDQKMVFAVQVQGSKLRSQSVKSMYSQLSVLSERISEAHSRDEDKAKRETVEASNERKSSLLTREESETLMDLIQQMEDEQVDVAASEEDE